jgi:hypothetical protein
MHAGTGALQGGRPPSREMLQNVAYKTIARKGMELTPDITRAISDAIDSLMQKALAAREGGNPKRYPDPNQPFYGYRVDPDRGPSHYRAGGFPPRDRERWRYTGSEGDPSWLTRSRPGGGPLSRKELSDPSDAFNINPRMDQYLVDTPSPRVRPMPDDGGYATVIDDMVRKFKSEPLAQAHLNRQGYGNIPENWTGPVESYGYPGVKGSPAGNLDVDRAARGPELLRSLARQDPTSGMGGVLSDLAKRHRGVPRHTLRNELRRGPIAELARKRPEDLDYTTYSDDQERFEDVLRALREEMSFKNFFDDFGLLK